VPPPPAMSTLHLGQESKAVLMSLEQESDSAKKHLRNQTHLDGFRHVSCRSVHCVAVITVVGLQTQDSENVSGMNRGPEVCFSF
jgi:hypothetical protein